MKDRIEFLKELIRCRPVSADVEQVNAVAGKVREFLDSEGLYSCVETIRGRSVVYGATEETTTPDVLLNVHMDVVPAEDHQFEPFEKDGWLHGRGANDCLGNVVIASRALARLKGQASVGVVYSADEEIGGLTTAGMVELGYVATKLILVLDGPEYAIATAQKGVVTLTLSAGGKAAHSSTPWLGENAIDRLIDGYLKIRDMFPDARPGDEWHNTLGVEDSGGHRLQPCARGRVHDHQHPLHRARRRCADRGAHPRADRT
jgi:succinyl-diaminopimelate desuccinylase